MFDDLDMSVKN